VTAADKLLNLLLMLKA